MQTGAGIAHARGANAPRNKICRVNRRSRVEKLDGNATQMNAVSLEVQEGSRGWRHFFKDSLKSDRKFWG